MYVRAYIIYTEVIYMCQCALLLCVCAHACMHHNMHVLVSGSVCGCTNSSRMRRTWIHARMDRLLRIHQVRECASLNVFVFVCIHQGRVCARIHLWMFLWSTSEQGMYTCCLACTPYMEAMDGLCLALICMLEKHAGLVWDGQRIYISEPEFKPRSQSSMCR